MVFCKIINLVGAKRVPLIKFRKGGYGASAGGTTTSGTSGKASVKAGGKTSAKGTNAIEDWELPARFARKPISVEEMEYINNGGPV